MSIDLQALVRSGRLRRADAALGEWITRAFPDSHPDVALAAALAARAVGDGHSALHLDAAQDWLARMDARGEVPALPALGNWRTSLRASDAVRCVADGDESFPPRPLVLDPQDRVYLARYFGYEQRLAQDLIARAQADRLLLVTGGPGTGKTHGVVRTLAALADEAHAQSRSLRIALAAPTGKAAARLAESVRAQVPGLGLSEAVTAMIPREASTLHRLLGLSAGSARARFHRGAELPHDVVVVDEVSMVDLPLMAKLADAVREDAMLVLLGDPDQLSAVEAGDVLGALVDAARTPPLSRCHTRLAESHRFSGQGALARLANAIVAGAADAALAVFDNDPSVQLCTDDARSARLLAHAVDAYRAIGDARDAAAALSVAKRFRVLTALRHGPAGSLALDRAIEQRLKRLADVRADAPWWRGRLLMVTVNRAELGLFNGDVGVVWQDDTEEPRVWFDTAEGTLRAIPYAALPPHEGAFVLTVHKAQGSEFERVALATGPDSAVLSRELLYTGVTRARKAITLYSTTDVLRAGIGRRTLRMTGLADRLREVAGT